MTTVHTYIRCVNKIYVGDAADQWRELHSFETEKRAKRWQRDQEKKRPGSVTVGSPPVQVIYRMTDRAAAKERARLAEIRRLALQQERDQALDRDRRFQNSPVGKLLLSTMSGKTAQLAQAYVAPDRDASSFLRERSATRSKSRSARNTRATFGGMSRV